MMRPIFTTLAPVLALAAAPTAFADVTFSASTLFITTGDADDDIQIDVGPMPGEVTVSGVYNGGTFAGVRAIVAMPGDGDDEIDIDGRAPFLPRLFVDMGDDDDRFDVDFVFSEFFIDVRAAGIFLRTGEGEDDVTISLKSHSGELNASIDLELGDGSNDVDVDVAPEGDSGVIRVGLDIQSGEDDDEVEFDVGGDSGLSYARLRGALGDGGDDVDVDVETRLGGAPTLELALDLGSGDDEFDSDASGNDLALLGTLRGQDGEDSIEVLSQAGFIGGAVLDAGADDDDVTFHAVGRHDSATSILAGTGDDDVEVLTQTSQTQTPTTSDGGPGEDVFSGIGLAVNFEEID